MTTTLDALSSVAKLSVSMTMLMSSGVYNKPPQAADGSVSFIEDSFDVKSDSHSLSTTQRYQPPLRIESLPNIQQGGAGGSSTPANERRKAFSSKIRRKRPTVSTTTTGNDKTRRLSVQESIASTCSVAASTDPPTTTTLPLTPRGSPINNCGIRIVIDQSVDVEPEVDSVTAIYPTSGLTFCEMDDREVSASNSQMFLLSDMI